MKLSARIAKRFPPRLESTGFTLDIAFEADPGITVLFGASGAGKSLTLESIAGFSSPDAGRILLGDSILFDGASRIHVPPRDRECGYVFQSSALFPHMTLRQNLLFAAERRPRLERHRRVAEMIERFHLADLAGRLPRELSGGQRQRGSIARALIAAPKILLLDEPARGFDAGLRAELHALLRELRRDLAIPMLLVTHDLDEAVTLGDRMLIYEAGRIVQSGVPQAVLSRPTSSHIASLVGCVNLLPAEILALDPGRNSSRLRLPFGELNGPYLPGHLIGDRATLAIRADDLQVHSSAGENRIPAILESSVEHARHVELRFAGDLCVLAPRRDLDLTSGTRDWFIEFPPASLRLLAAGK